MMMASLETSKTTMLLVTLVVLVMGMVVDGCERRGEELICQGELPTLDEKEVREIKVYERIKSLQVLRRGYYQRGLITVH